MQERSTYEVMHAAFKEQCEGNRGNPPDLTPVFQQHNWNAQDFYAELHARTPVVDPTKLVVVRSNEYNEGSESD